MSLKVKKLLWGMAMLFVIVLLLGVGVFLYFDFVKNANIQAGDARVSQGTISADAFDSSLNGNKPQGDFFQEYGVDITSDESKGPDVKEASWKGVTLKFPTGSDKVTLTFIVTNLNKQEQLTVWPEVTDMTESNVMVSIAGQEEINNVLAEAETEGDAELYTVTFSLIDKTKPTNFTFSIQIDFKSASDLPLSTTYDKLSFFTTHYVSYSNPNDPMPANCLSVKQASSTVGGVIEFPDFVLYNSKAYKVSEVEEFGFSEGFFQVNKNITGVTFSKTITDIKRHAFYNCPGLIGELNLQNIESIGERAFEGCKGLTGELNLQNVESIGERAFEGCKGLTGLTIGASLTSVGPNAFYEASGIKVVDYSGTVEQWAQISFGSRLANPTYYSKNLKINGQDVTEVNLNCETVGDNAFCFCENLTSLTLGENVKSIGDSAFYYCTEIASELHLQNVENVEYSAFEGCSKLTGELNFKNLKSVGYRAFYLCSGFTGELNLSNIENIASGAFCCCKNLTSLILNENVTVIGEGAFKSCTGLTGELNLQNVESVGEDAFYGCSSLTGDLNLPKAKSIGESAFEKCSGLNGYLTLPPSLTSIPNSAFDGCSNLKGNLNFENIESIGNGAFRDCSSLTGDLNLSKCTKLGDNAFSNCEGLDGELTLSPQLTVIPVAVFAGCSKLTGEINFQNITSIGQTAFSGCRKLTGELNLKNLTNERIGPGTFANCEGFSGALTLPSTVTTIVDTAFENCFNLTGSVDLSNVTYFGTLSFFRCRGLTGDLNLQNATWIGYQAFDGCSGLNGTLTLSSDLTSICSFAFSNCTQLQTVIIDSIEVAKGLAMKDSCGEILDITTKTALTTVKVKVQAGIDENAVGEYLRTRFSYQGIENGYYVFTRT